MAVKPAEILQQAQRRADQYKAANAPPRLRNIQSVLNQGPTSQQQALLDQQVNQRFEAGSGAIQRHAERLSAMLSGSAASRGLGQSSIGLGQQGMLGQSVIQQLTDLRGGLESQAAGQAFEIPFRNAQLHLGQRGQDIQNSQFARSLAEQRRQYNESNKGGGGIGAILGGAAGSILGPIGTAIGGSIGGMITGGGGNRVPSIESSRSWQQSVNSPYSLPGGSQYMSPSSNPLGTQFPT